MNAKYSGGSTYTVSVSAAEVEAWNHRWPGSSMRGRQVFEFDVNTGDLVDHIGRGEGGESVALADDAQKYGQAILGDHIKHKPR